MMGNTASPSIIELLICDVRESQDFEPGISMSMTVMPTISEFPGYRGHQEQKWIDG